jgi:hypothetical protein
MGNIKSRKAFKFSMELLQDNTTLPDGYLWTFTFKEVLDLPEAMKRWNKFCSSGNDRNQNLVNCFPAMGGLRVVEQHPGRDKLFPEMSSHGFHFHLATTDWLSVDVVRSLWERLAMGGRIDVKRIPKDKFMYLGKYLAKQRGQFKGVRQWSTVGTAERISARDIICNSHWTEAYKFLRVAIHGFNKLPWNNR